MTRAAHALEMMDRAVGELAIVASEMPYDSPERLLERRGVIRHIGYIRESVDRIREELNKESVE